MIFGFFSFILVLTHSVQVSGLKILNPERLEIGANQRLEPSLENQWLSRFYRDIHFENDISTAIVPDFDQALSTAQTDYLHLHLEQALDQIDTAEELLPKLIFSPKLKEKLQNLCALKLMVLDAKQLRLTDQKDAWAYCLPFIKDKNFLKLLPLKLQQEVSNISLQRSKILASQKPKKTISLYLYGKKLKFPLLLFEGRYLVISLEKSRLTAYWLDISPPKPGNLAPVFSKLKDFNLWPRLSKAGLSHLKTLMPRKLQGKSIYLLFSDQNAQRKQIVLNRAPLMRVRKKSKPKMSSQTPSALKWDDFDDSKKKDDSSIFKSPWLWLAVGLLSGSAAYLIYDSQQTKSVRTP